MDPYLSLAELSLALVGFAALIGVIGPRASEPTAIDALTLRMLVEIALTAFTLSLLPVVLEPLAADRVSLWRICSGAAALVVGSHIASSFVRSRPIAPDRVVTPLTFGAVGLSAVLIIMNVRNALGWTASVEEWPFRAAIVAQLLISALFFFIRFFVLDSRNFDRSREPRA